MLMREFETEIIIASKSKFGFLTLIKVQRQGRIIRNGKHLVLYAKFGHMLKITTD